MCWTEIYSGADRGRNLCADARVAGPEPWRMPCARLEWRRWQRAMRRDRREQQGRVRPRAGHSPRGAGRRVCRCGNSRAADDFSRPFQEFITEYCWGAVWGRPGLPKKTRSIINLAMLTALNRQHELKIHVKGALKNGCTKDEIMEVLLQTAIYCGVPGRGRGLPHRARGVQGSGRLSASANGFLPAEPASPRPARQAGFRPRTLRAIRRPSVPVAQLDRATVS